MGVWEYIYQYKCVCVGRYMYLCTYLDASVHLLSLDPLTHLLDTWRRTKPMSLLPPLARHIRWYNQRVRTRKHDGGA